MPHGLVVVVSKRQVKSSRLHDPWKPLCDCYHHYHDHHHLVANEPDWPIFWSFGTVLLRGRDGAAVYKSSATTVMMMMMIVAAVAMRMVVVQEKTKAQSEATRWWVWSMDAKTHSTPIEIVPIVRQVTRKGYSFQYLWNSYHPHHHLVFVVNAADSANPCFWDKNFSAIVVEIDFVDWTTTRTTR